MREVWQCAANHRRTRRSRLLHVRDLRNSRSVLIAVKATRAPAVNSDVRPSAVFWADDYSLSAREDTRESVSQALDLVRFLERQRNITAFTPWAAPP